MAVLLFLTIKKQEKHKKQSTFVNTMHTPSVQQAAQYGTRKHTEHYQKTE